MTIRQRVFVDQQVLTAAQVNDNLRDITVCDTVGELSSVDSGIYAVFCLANRRMYTRNAGGTFVPAARAMPDLIAEVVNGAGSGSLAPGGTTGAVNINVPAHQPGVLRIVFHGSWYSAGNAAAFSSIYYGPGAWQTSTNTGGAVYLPGSQDRQHNGGSTTPQKIASEGFVVTNGTAGVATVAIAPDSGGNAVQIFTNNWQVWQH